MPDALQPSGFASLVGVLADPPVLTRALDKDAELCRNIVQIGQSDIPILARGELAIALSAVKAGSAVAVSGTLISYSWRTQESAARERLEVEADRIEVLHGPVE